MSDILHDIWEDDDGLTMLCYANELGAEPRTLLEENSRIIHSFNAHSHFDAMTKYYNYMGWGIYENHIEQDKDAYVLESLRTRQQLWFIVDEILWQEWDPIGVNDSAPRDEYRSYVSPIVTIVMTGASIAEIASVLHRIERGTIGVTGDYNACFKIAQKLDGLYKKIASN